MIKHVVPHIPCRVQRWPIWRLLSLQWVQWVQPQVYCLALVLAVLLACSVLGLEASTWRLSITSLVL